MQSGALTGKTGYTSKAGYCYVGAYQENGRNYSYALLACGWPNHKTYKWQDSKALIAYGNEYYAPGNVGNMEQTYEVEIPTGISVTETGYDYESTTMVKNDGSQWEMLLGDNDQITTEFVHEPVTLPIKKDDKAGSIAYYVNGVFAGEQELFYTENIYNFDYQWCFTYFLQEFLQKASF